MEIEEIINELKKTDVFKEILDLDDSDRLPPRPKMWYSNYPKEDHYLVLMVEVNNFLMQDRYSFGSEEELRDRGVEFMKDFKDHVYKSIESRQ